MSKKTSQVHLNYLDLFSTSPTKEDLCSDLSSLKCLYNAPYFAYKIEGKKYAVAQGNCHHWDCPKCGEGRAKQEYGRMVEGCRKLAEKHTLWFITITCKGKGLSHKDAENGYLEWTNRFLDACRIRCKRNGGVWTYVQVTERQKRAHPHSHILTTFDPSDVYLGHVYKWETKPNGGRQSIRTLALRSDWLADQVVRSGLGEQYDLSKVESVEGAARYVAKYMFKDTMLKAVWPKGWKRVRYSQSFPKLEREKTDAMVLIKQEDWINLGKKAVVVVASGLDAYSEARDRLHYIDTIIRLRKVGESL